MKKLIHNQEQVTKLCPQPREVGAPSIVSQSQFLQQLSAFTHGFFHGFDFSNVVVIGGAVVGTLLPIPPDPLSPPPAVFGNSDDEDESEGEEDKEDEREGKQDEEDEKAKTKQVESEPRTSPVTPSEYYAELSPFKGSDINLCIYGGDDVDFGAKLRYIFEHVQKMTGQKVQAIASGSRVIFCPPYPYRHVQIVLTYAPPISLLLPSLALPFVLLNSTQLITNRWYRKFRSLSHILTGVDIDCSADIPFHKTSPISPPPLLSSISHLFSALLFLNVFL